MFPTLFILRFSNPGLSEKKMVFNHIQVKTLDKTVHENLFQAEILLVDKTYLKSADLFFVYNMHKPAKQFFRHKFLYVNEKFS